MASRELPGHSVAPRVAAMPPAKRRGNVAKTSGAMKYVQEPRKPNKRGLLSLAASGSYRGRPLGGTAYQPPLPTAMRPPSPEVVRALVELEAEHGVEHAAGTPRGQTPIKRGGALASIAFFEQLTC